MAVSQIPQARVPGGMSTAREMCRRSVLSWHRIAPKPGEAIQLVVAANAPSAHGASEQTPAHPKKVGKGGFIHVSESLTPNAVSGGLFDAGCAHDVGRAGGAYPRQQHRCGCDSGDKGGREREWGGHQIPALVELRSVCVP